MFFAPLLKMRDKLTRKRHALTEDEEKPFLEHLEDLRKTLSKIVLVLTIAIVSCFVFNNWFFKIMERPLDAAGLRDAKERNLPAAVLDLKAGEQQAAWWRIHGVARGMADLEGPQREAFIRAAAPDAFTRQMAHALLFYHVADTLPGEQREGYIKAATALLPAEDAAPVAAYAGQLSAAGTAVSLEKPHDFVETEAFAPAETFMLSMKLSMFAGIIVSFPLLFYFLLEFILPGLTPKERKMMFPALSIGFALFITGVLFAFFFVIPRALEFFHEYSTEIGIKDRWKIGNYISFVTSFCLIFGLAFELPVVVMVMVKLGLLTCTTMRRTRAWAVVIILVASAVLTPTGDAFTMSLLAAPMIIMYETCIWLAYFHEKKERRLEEEEQRRDQARRAALVGVASVQAGRPGDGGSGSAENGDAPYDHYHHGHGQGHEYGHGESGAATEPGVTPVPHPYHPEDTDETPPSDYEQYLRDHRDLYPAEQTHPESVPVGERTPATGERPEGETPGTATPEAAAEPPAAEPPAVTPEAGESPDQPPPAAGSV